MTILKHILPILGIATFIHAQDAADSNQDFPVEESTVPVDEETEAPTIVDVAPTPTAKKSKAKAKQQEPQQVYISNELDYVPVSKSVMQLTLREDDPADAPDPRDGDDTPKKKEVQTSGGLFGFGFLADDSDAAVSGESGSSKNSSFKLGLHAGLGYLSIEYYDDEELDRFKGREGDEYAEEEAEEFRNILYTMRQEEVAGWIRSLQLRQVNLPDEVKDEVFLIVGERRIG